MMVRQEIEEGKEVEEGKGGRGGKDIAAGRLGRSSAAPVHESNAGREAAARVQKEKHAGHYDRALDQIAGGVGDARAEPSKLRVNRPPTRDARWIRVEQLLN
jgi:hypothetical protein